ncbi:hypothetical protein Taro_018730 [Colocasia esculenta]|uniref:Uncharacterized protein n=1 Tax=Colocasia esculenta TaxID=4460 RepID=A0A843UJD5_COLES|nr:hypothetical protein [Colocasia esculenta]
MFLCLFRASRRLVSLPSSGRAHVGRRRRAVVLVPVASSGSPSQCTSPSGNNPQKTTGLFSFGRPKEEKLKSHHHPQLNSVNWRVNVVNRRLLHRQREPGGFRERPRDPATERKRTVHRTVLRAARSGLALLSCFRLYASSLAVDVYLRYISYQTRVIALPGPPGPWAATAKIGSSAWAEGRVLGSLHRHMGLCVDRQVLHK